MSVMDVQLQLWQSQVDLWRRMFEMQLSMAKGVIDMSAAWTWRAVDVARDVAEAEQARTEEVVAPAAKVMRASAATKARQPRVDSPVEDAEVIAPLATEVAADVVEAVTETVEQATETSVATAEELAAPTAAPKKRRSAPARRSTGRTTAARRPRSTKS
jgi:hypothetical protein